MVMEKMISEGNLTRKILPLFVILHYSNCLVFRMLSNVERVLQSEEAPKDSPQTSVFEFQRPDVEHIQPPPGMDLSMQTLNACCADFEFEEDESDEDEHVPRGRISPCTFLAWSKDCAVWKEANYEMPNSKASWHKPERFAQILTSLLAAGKYISPTPAIPRTL